MSEELQPIDWSDTVYEVVDGVTMEITAHTGVSRSDLIHDVAKLFEQNTPFDYYVYCLEYENDGETRWYVGETANLGQRLSSHKRDKNLRNIETIEGADSRDAARDREDILSYEVAIEKNTATQIDGGQ